MESVVLEKETIQVINCGNPRGGTYEMMDKVIKAKDSRKEWS